MVGREQELALVIERWRQAVAGEDQAMLLVGEAGIGKSRLIQATLEAVSPSRAVAPDHEAGIALNKLLISLGWAWCVHVSC